MALKKISRQEVEQEARMYHSNQDAARALGIRSERFSALVEVSARRCPTGGKGDGKGQNVKRHRQPAVARVFPRTA